MTKGAFGDSANFEQVSFYNEQTKKDEKTVVKMLNRTDRAVIIHRRKRNAITRT